MKFLLYPLSIVYDLITALRNFLFDIGLINSVQYKIPTIGVGNLSTGGTGKSMLVNYLIELLKIKYSLTTLSRGYNRDTSGFIQATSKSSAYEIGDEPYQFYSKHPEINVVVCEDRRKGMKLILNNLPNTQISIWDDIFQHRYVKPGLMLLTTTFKYPYYKDACGVGFSRRRCRPWPPRRCSERWSTRLAVHPRADRHLHWHQRCDESCSRTQQPLRRPSW